MAGNVGPFSGSFEERPVPNTNRIAGVAGEVSDAPVGVVRCDMGQGEVRAGVVTDEEPDNMAASNRALVKPTNSDGGRTETKRRKTSLTVKRKGAKPMAAVRMKTKRGSDVTEEPRLKLVGQGDSTATTQKPAGKLDLHSPVLPTKAEGQGSVDIRPRLIDAASAAKLRGVSKSGWWSFHSAGKCPLPVRLGRATRWRQDELSDWIDAGCPARVKWKWKPDRRRGFGS